MRDINLKMKTKLLLLISVLLIIATGYAQAPNLIPYQAVARDAAGNVVANRPIGLRFTIRNLLPFGTILYQETQLTDTLLGQVIR